MIKVSILEIVCVVHGSDVLADWIPHNYTCHCLGSYIRNNAAYPIFVIMKAEKDARIKHVKS
jgi:hypothetical protein